MLLVAPVTTYRGQPWADRAPRLYPRLAAGTARLPQSSLVLLDQLQMIDAQRVLRYLGKLSETDYKAVREGLGMLLGI